MRFSQTCMGRVKCTKRTVQKSPTKKPCKRDLRTRDLMRIDTYFTFWYVFHVLMRISRFDAYFTYLHAGKQVCQRSHTKELSTGCQKSPTKEPYKRALPKSPTKEPYQRALPKSPPKELHAENQVYKKSPTKEPYQRRALWKRPTSVGLSCTNGALPKCPAEEPYQSALQKSPTKVPCKRALPRDVLLCVVMHVVMHIHIMCCDVNISTQHIT